MRPLSGELLLTAWERGAFADDLRRPLVLLSIALPGRKPGQLGAIPLTERNLLLLRLHDATFGPVLDVFGECPDCGARLEFAVPVTALASRLDGPLPADPVTWEEQGSWYRLRQITTDDLVACLDVPEESAAQDLLLSRCLEIVPTEDSELSSAAPPAAAAATAAVGVLQRFEQLNAAAELSCAIECPGCAASQVLDLDLGRFVWAEVRVAARRLVTEIHDLASAYGWSERSIARMSAARRGAYLELLSA